MNSLFGSTRAAACAVMFAVASMSCQRTVGPQTRHAEVTASGSIRFDLKWPTAPTGARDALWVFGKYTNDGEEWLPVRIDAPVTAQPAGPFEIQGVPERTGLIVTATQPAAEWTELEIPSAIQDSTNLRPVVRMFAIQVTRVDPGAFYAGDGEVVALTGHLQQNDGGNAFRVLNESALVLGMDSGRALGNSDGSGMANAEPEPFVSASVTDDYNDASRIVLPAAFPKGTRPFLVMKHELTQAQYADFLNTLTGRQRLARDPNGGSLLNFQNGYAITLGRQYVALIPDRPVNFVSWMDLAAYADWAGLRPMTELEFEKAARGTTRPVPSQFAWGTEDVPDHRYFVSQDRSPAERVTNPAPDGGNASWSGTHGTLTPTCASCLDRPLAGGSFGHDPATSGESVYGVMELSGNLYERVVSIGHAAGRRFDGSHGDGRLSADGHAAGQEVSTWPGSRLENGTPQVTGAMGSGLRGGSWTSPAERLRISDRAYAATPDTSRSPVFGIRLVRGLRPIP